ncbi:MAG: ribonuclease D [Proteobacteria bacterium]|nr:ribonuclease D [Pseudomonadota bacterium]
MLINGHYLRHICEKILSSSPSWLGVDTEFIRQKTYWPEVCLIQLYDGKEVYLIDVLDQQTDLAYLKPLFQSPSITKIFHSSRQDLEIFWHQLKVFPTPLFDTQLAATLVGMGQNLSYETLVKKILGRSINKTFQYTNWAKRPLTKEQLLYAADDVRYLGELFHFLYQHLEQNNRLNWLKELTSFLLNPDLYDLPVEKAWYRLKLNHLKSKQTPFILQQLAAWREHQAKTFNYARKFILKDETIFYCALQKHLTYEKFQLYLQNHKENFLNETHLKDFWQCYQKALETPCVKEIRKSVKLTPQQKKIFDALNKAFNDYAKSNNVPKKWIISSEDLYELSVALAEKKDHPLLHTWRKDIIAKNT